MNQHYHKGNMDKLRGDDGRVLPSKGDLHSWEIDIWLKILPEDHSMYVPLKRIREMRRDAKRRTHTHWTRRR